MQNHKALSHFFCKVNTASCPPDHQTLLMVCGSISRRYCIFHNLLGTTLFVLISIQGGTACSLMPFFVCVHMTAAMILVSWFNLHAKLNWAPRSGFTNAFYQRCLCHRRHHEKYTSWSARVCCCLRYIWKQSADTWTDLQRQDTKSTAPVILLFQITQMMHRTDWQWAACLRLVLLGYFSKHSIDALTKSRTERRAFVCSFLACLLKHPADVYTQSTT